MNSVFCIRCLCLFAFAATISLVTSPVLQADEQPTVEELVRRLENVEKELQRLKRGSGQLPANEKEQKIHVMLEDPFLGASYYGSSSGIRYFASRLLFVNLTPRTVKVKQENITLKIDDKVYKLGDVPSQLQYQSVTVGNQSIQLRNMKSKKESIIASGKTGSTWIVFANLPKGTQIPEMKLDIQLGDEKLALDVNRYAAASLELHVDRVGPRNSLGLLTISGTLNTVNVGTLVDTLDDLTAEKIARFVIRWQDAAAPVDSSISSWLQNVANRTGRSEFRDSRFPLVPSSIRELHLSRLPGYNASSGRSSSLAPRIHKTDMAAVIAALQTAYEVLPRDELIKEIESGHPLTRAAAISGGGGRLPAEKLPILLQFADDKDPVIQTAAMRALRHFGERAAVDKLVHHTKKNVDPISPVAIESLAASRFATAHNALLELLENEPPTSKVAIVNVLARYPRSIWSNTIYDYVKDDDQKVALTALKALVHIGHPELVDILKDALHSGNASLEAEAFNRLVTRNDVESERIAMEYTLKKLETTPPNSLMVSLLTRTKDPRAVPLLLKHFANAKSSSRSSLISTLTSIGDQTVVDVFLDKYDELNSSEQAAVLTALRQMRSPAFRKLAEKALLTKNSSLVSNAVQGLQEDGSHEAVRMLVEAYEKTTYTSAWSYISNALATLGSPEARQALRRATKSGNASRRSYATSAIKNMYQRSPGYQYIYQARNYSKQQKWDETIKYYSMAIKLDSQLPDAYAGRGTAYLNQAKPVEARKDFTKAVGMDDTNSVAVTGLGTVMVFEGDIEEGLKYIEDRRADFKNDVNFYYNAACARSRAIQVLKKDEDADHQKQIQSLQDKAIADLSQAKKMGFRDFTWMKKDPDLKVLHDVPGFIRIHSPNAPDARKKPLPEKEKAEPADDLN